MQQGFCEGLPKSLMLRTTLVREMARDMYAAPQFCQNFLKNNVDELEKWWWDQIPLMTKGNAVSFCDSLTHGIDFELERIENVMSDLTLQSLQLTVGH